MPLIGKILFDDDETYLNDHFGELLNEKNFVTIGHKVFNMPSFGDVLNNIGDLLVDE